MIFGMIAVPSVQIGLGEHKSGGSCESLKDYRELLLLELGSGDG